MLRTSRLTPRHSNVEFPSNNYPSTGVIKSWLSFDRVEPTVCGGEFRSWHFWTPAHLAPKVLHQTPACLAPERSVRVHPDVVLSHTTLSERHEQ